MIPPPYLLSDNMTTIMRIWKNNLRNIHHNLIRSSRSILIRIPSPSQLRRISPSPSRVTVPYNVPSPDIATVPYPAPDTAPVISTAPGIAPDPAASLPRFQPRSHLNRSKSVKYF